MLGHVRVRTCKPLHQEGYVYICEAGSRPYKVRTTKENQEMERDQAQKVQKYEKDRVKFYLSRGNSGLRHLEKEEQDAKQANDQEMVALIQSSRKEWQDKLSSSLPSPSSSSSSLIAGKPYARNILIYHFIHINNYGNVSCILQ